MLARDHEDSTIPTFRHAAATWLMQQSVGKSEAASFLGMSLQTPLKTYGHYHPDFMQDVVEAITRKA